MALLAILLQSAGQLVIVVNFKMNQAYIASVLCENKNNPELQCNGKCQLNKKLQQHETTEQQLPPQIKLKEPLLFVDEMAENKHKNNGFFIHSFLSETTPALQSGFERVVLHPPEPSLFFL
jgi:hypothetical protein